MFQFGFTILPILFIFVFIGIIVKMITQFVQNEKSPVVATNALLIDKRHSWDSHLSGDGSTMSNDYYYLTFEFDTGSRVEYTVTRRLYHEAIENEWGTLTFQGTRFLRFESESQTLLK